MGALAELDASTAKALVGIGKVKFVPGTLLMLANFGSPLPMNVWEAEDEAHLLVLPNSDPMAEPLLGLVVCSNGGVKAFAEALDAEEDLVSGAAGDTLTTYLPVLGETAVFIDLPDNRVLISNSSVSTAMEFRRILGRWTPPVPPGNEVWLRVDGPNAMKSYGKTIESFLNILRMTYFDFGDQMVKLNNALEENKDNPRIRDDILKARELLTGLRKASVSCIGAVMDFLGSTGVWGMGLDFSGDNLRLTTSLSGGEDTYLSRNIEAAGDSGESDGYPFAQLLPRDAIVYSYFSNTNTFNKESLAFLHHLVEQLFSEAAPEIVDLHASLVEDYFKAGPLGHANGLFVLDDYGYVEPYYSRWNRPELVPPLIEKALASLVRLQEIGLEAMTYYYVEDAKDSIDSGNPDDVAWLEGIRESGFAVPLEPVVTRGAHGEGGKTKYMEIAFQCDLQQFFPPSERDDNNEFVTLVDYVLDHFRIIVATRDDVVIGTMLKGAEIGVDEWLDMLFSRFDQAGDDSFIVHLEKVESNQPRQDAFSMIRFSEFVVYTLLEEYGNTISEDPELEAALKRLAAEVDGEDTFMYGHGGVRDGAFTFALDFPAHTLNIFLKNYFRLEQAFAEAYGD